MSRMQTPAFPPTSPLPLHVVAIVPCGADGRVSDDQSQVLIRVGDFVEVRVLIAHVTGATTVQLGPHTDPMLLAALRHTARAAFIAYWLDDNSGFFEWIVRVIVARVIVTPSIAKNRDVLAPLVWMLAEGAR